MRITTLQQQQQQPSALSLSRSTDNDDSGIVMDHNDADDQQQPQEKPPSLLTRMGQIYNVHEFVILVLASILAARAYPPLGAYYVAPKITAGWIYVCFIFLLAGLGLKTEEFTKAFQQIWFNLYLQVFNFGVVSGLVYSGCWALQNANLLSTDLAHGMIVCSCLPTTINMVIVLTKAASGDESLAIVNAAAGNMIGVFLSPVLILGYLGVQGDTRLMIVFYNLALRVVLPITVGQVIRKTMPRVVAYQKRHKRWFRKLQEYSLVFIVYTVFCRTFERGKQSTVGEIFLMILFVFLFLLFFMALAWVSSGLLFGTQPEVRIVALYGCTEKTVSMGIPVINAIYENSPALGLYTLPLLIWHPMQLVLGSFLVPFLRDFVARENIRLGREEPDSSSTASRPRSGGSRQRRQQSQQEQEEELLHPQAAQVDSEKGENKAINSTNGADDDDDDENADHNTSSSSTIELAQARKSKLSPRGPAFSRVSRFEPAAAAAGHHKSNKNSSSSSSSSSSDQQPSADDNTIDQQWECCCFNYLAS